MRQRLPHADSTQAICPTRASRRASCPSTRAREPPRPRPDLVRVSADPCRAALRLSSRTGIEPVRRQSTASGPALTASWAWVGSIPGCGQRILVHGRPRSNVRTAHLSPDPTPAAGPLGASSPAVLPPDGSGQRIFARSRPANGPSQRVSARGLLRLRIRSPQLRPRSPPVAAPLPSTSPAVAPRRRPSPHVRPRSLYPGPRDRARNGRRCPGPITATHMEAAKVRLSLARAAHRDSLL